MGVWSEVTRGMEPGPEAEARRAHTGEAGSLPIHRDSPRGFGLGVRPHGELRHGHMTFAGDARRLPMIAVQLCLENLRNLVHGRLCLRRLRNSFEPSVKLKAHTSLRLGTVRISAS